MLKSGVGRLRRRDGVRRTPPFRIVITAGLPLSVYPRERGREGMYATSKPRFASGGYSVYLRILLSNSHVSERVVFCGIESWTSNCVPRRRSIAGR